MFVRLVSTKLKNFHLQTSDQFCLSETLNKAVKKNAVLTDVKCDHCFVI